MTFVLSPEFSNQPFPEDWHRLTSVISITGIHHYKEDALEFIRNITREKDINTNWGIILEREPLNKYDNNAIRVIGWNIRRSIFRNKKAFNILGYVPADTARMISEYPNLTESDPLGAQVQRIYVSDDGFIDIKIRIFAGFADTD